MSKIALYRKYRPQNFLDVIGQEHIIKTLKNSILRNNISHAYLFCGPRGSGKTSVARLFAKALNCKDLSSFEPCNKCDSCLEIYNNKSIDLIEIDAASNTGVDDVREIIKNIKFSPIKSKYKIFIIDECHQLSKSAFNALLKVLEEPPGYAIFILATTEPQKMIDTVISRCQRFDFKKVKIQEIVKKLEIIANKEGVKFEETALLLIAQNAKGSFRDAETLLDQCISFSEKGSFLKTEDVKEILGIFEISQISDFIEIISQKNINNAFSYLNKIIDSGLDLQEFIKAIIFYLRCIMLFQLNQNDLMLKDFGLSEKEIEKLKQQSQLIQEKYIQVYIKIFIELENNIRYSQNQQVLIELAIIDIINLK